MKKYHFNKIGLAVCVAGLFSSVQVGAIDLAAASGLLADVAVISAQSSSALAAAANSGDVEAIVEAQNRADAVDSAMAEAQEAYAAMERAVAGGDEDAAAAAAEDLTAAQQKAGDALNGVFPEVDSQETAAMQAVRGAQTIPPTFMMYRGRRMDFAVPIREYLVRCGVHHHKVALDLVSVTLLLSSGSFIRFTRGCLRFFRGLYYE